MDYLTVIAPISGVCGGALFAAMPIRRRTQSIIAVCCVASLIVVAFTPAVIPSSRKTRLPHFMEETLFWSIEAGMGALVGWVIVISGRVAQAALRKRRELRNETRESLDQKPRGNGMNASQQRRNMK